MKYILILLCSHKSQASNENNMKLSHKSIYFCMLMLLYICREKKGEKNNNAKSEIICRRKATRTKERNREYSIHFVLQIKNANYGVAFLLIFFFSHDQTAKSYSIHEMSHRKKFVSFQLKFVFALISVDR